MCRVKLTWVPKLRKCCQNGGVILTHAILCVVEKYEKHCGHANKQFWKWLCFLNIWKDTFCTHFQSHARTILSYSIICSSVHPMSDKEFRYWSSLCHLSSMDLYPPCLGWRAFCNISFALEVHSLPFRRSMFGTASGVLVDNIAWHS